MTFFGVTIAPAVLASLLAAFVATAGIVMVIKRERWALRNRAYLTAFAAGVLVTTALTLFPEALAASPHASMFALAGYAALYSINIMFRQTTGTVIATMFAIGLHSFIDGFEYGILFDYDIVSGIMASFGLIAHEFVEGAILFLVLRAARLPVWLAFTAAFFGAAVTTPLGAVLSQPLLAAATPEVLGAFLALSVGAMLYLGATHLPNHMHRERKKQITFAYMQIAFAYMGGVALALILWFAKHNAAEQVEQIMTLINR